MVIGVHFSSRTITLGGAIIGYGFSGTMITGEVLKDGEV
jgi:hypothetical protein